MEQLAQRLRRRRQYDPAAGIPLLHLTMPETGP
jgi:hypothetical protein